MIRRRYQTGSLIVRGKRKKVWVARWREAVLAADGTLKSIRRSEIIGTLADFPTKRQARALLESRLHRSRWRVSQSLPPLGWLRWTVFHLASRIAHR
jgi:hypothetical protein